MIYHIIKKEKWDSFQREKVYAPSSIEREGYIHCSFENQLLKVAETYHKGQFGLLVLCINEDSIKEFLKIEDLFNMNEKYPHIYSELPINAVDIVAELKLDKMGDFILPDLNSKSLLFVEYKDWT